ncbi:MAG: site-specific DNA-methyltransferase [Verrucomicrobia bacterium A1]|nr:MAG: site-specific DNA-methyltransferase [Verrucomicrobia bacterium A1]
MPTLDWIGKQAVVNHHREVPFHLLRDVPDLSVGDPGTGNLIVEGDNLTALKALLPYYAGQVKCIYIDPPYNTGNEGWVYNDNVNSPLIKEWLGKTVGKEAEDLSRHDKWLCMMYPRLAVLREFLSSDGVIFISIDDNEAFHLQCLLCALFGEQNFVTDIAWHKRVSPANDAKYFSTDHDHILVFARDKGRWRPNRVPRSAEQLKYYSNPDGDPRGTWNSAAYTCAKTAAERPNLYYPIINPNTGAEIWPSKIRVWAYDRDRHRKNDAEGLIWWGKNGQARMPRLKKFLGGRDVVPRSIWSHTDAGHNQEANLELSAILPNSHFDTPKPSRLVERILQVSTEPNSLVLDSFAGTGTTGHATLKLNKQDGGNRRFILVEMEPKIAREITAERVKRVAQGYTNAKGKEVAGLGGGFRYCRLGDPLFDSGGRIRDTVRFADLARHVYFTETGEPLPRERVPNSPLLGVCRGVAVYLLYNGILGDKSAAGGNILTRAVLARLPSFDGPKAIYAAGCLLDPVRLRSQGIVFRQTPYEIRVA